MEMQKRLYFESLINESILNQEMLIGSIAKLNKKINRVYRKMKNAECWYETTDSNEWLLQYEQLKNDFDKELEYRKPILYTLMKEYRLSLDKVKKLTSQVATDDTLSYANIDRIRKIILSDKYSIDRTA